MNPLPISVGNSSLTNNEEVASFKGPRSSKKTENISFETPGKAKYLTIHTANDFLTINEVRVFGAPPVPVQGGFITQKYPSFWCRQKPNCVLVCPYFGLSARPLSSLDRF